MSGNHRFAAGIIVIAAWLTALPASAFVDIVPVAPEDETPVKKLTITGKDAEPGPTVIVVQQIQLPPLPQPYPGGCFNCSTLRANHENTSRILSRAHSFSQGFYGTGVQKYIYLSR